MRFNDYHKQVCAALKLTPEAGREIRTFIMRCYQNRVSPNACIPLTKQEMEKRASAAAGSTKTATG